MTGNELVAFARGKIGTPYVYGMKGKVLTQKTYDRLRILFGPLVWESDAAKIGQVCVDCSGLISWGTGILRNSQGYHDTADAVFPIATIGQDPLGRRSGARDISAFTSAAENTSRRTAVPTVCESALLRAAALRIGSA